MVVKGVNLLVTTEASKLYNHNSPVPNNKVKLVNTTIKLLTIRPRCVSYRLYIVDVLVTRYGRVIVGTE